MIETPFNNKGTKLKFIGKYSWQRRKKRDSSKV